MFSNVAINPDIIGSIAAVLTTTSFFPQTIKVIKTRNTEAISLLMYILFTIGVAFWLTYGILIDRYPMIIANTITLTLSSTILIIKIREK